VDFRSAKRAFDRGRMIAFWNSWYDTLVSVDVLAVVIVVVVVLLALLSAAINASDRKLIWGSKIRHLMPLC
jgi:hypothetical protein